MAIGTTLPRTRHEHAINVITSDICSHIEALDAYDPDAVARDRQAARQPAPHPMTATEFREHFGEMPF